MTDRDLMVERIQAALQALDEAHVAKETLRKQTNSTTLNSFRQRMLKLANELDELKQILNHENDYMQDELAEVISETLHEPHSYRRIPPVEFAEEKK